MIDLIENAKKASVLVNVVERDTTQISFNSNLKTEEVCQRVILISDLREWLSSFDTSSATKCFEAVNLLKQRLEGEE